MERRSGSAARATGVARAGPAPGAARLCGPTREVVWQDARDEGPGSHARLEVALGQQLFEGGQHRDA